MRNKYNKLFLIGGIIIFVLMFGMTFVRADYGDWSDPKDDLRCFSKAKLQAFGIIIEEEGVEDVDDFITAVNEYWSLGTMSASPNCIDMVHIRIIEFGDMATITIEVEGRIKDCDRVYFLLYGNCSGNPWGLVMYFIQGGIGEADQSGFQYTDDEGNDVNGNVDISGGEISATYPNVENCELHILALAFDEYGESLCADRFPDPYTNINDGTGDIGDDETGSPYDSGYDGWDPITNFVDGLARIVLSFMCGRMAFIYFIAVFVVLSKIMVDRKNIASRVGGFIIMGFTMWIDINYSLEINYASPDITGDFSILSVIDFTICMMFLAFMFFTILNNATLIDDQVWTYYISVSLMFCESVMYMTPWWFYYCTGNPLTAFLCMLALIFVSVLILSLSEKYSKGRLM